jgi:hypothetical protein
LAKERRGFLYIIGAILGVSLLEKGYEEYQSSQEDNQRGRNDDTADFSDLNDTSSDTADSSGFDDIDGMEILSVDKVVNLEAYNYRYWEFESDSRKDFEGEFTVKSGPGVELLLMEKREFRRYESDQTYSYEQQSTEVAQQSYETEGVVPAGEYVIVLNNPCTFCDVEGSGPNSARVDVSITVE